MTGSSEFARLYLDNKDKKTNFLILEHSVMVGDGYHVGQLNPQTWIHALVLFRNMTNDELETIWLYLQSQEGGAK